jgi:poly-gamma-glutamate synthase PgsB/CapB
MSVIVTAATLGFLLAFLGAEKFITKRARRKIPLVIAVTGSRGKSSVVRLIASGLSASGQPILAKTTGSRASLILPSGDEEVLTRRGIPNIREQIALLNMCSRLHAYALIVEVMSIKPENYATEIGKILQPDILVLTNIRPDHVEAIGETPDEAAASFTFGIPPQCHVICPEDGVPNVFIDLLAKRQNRITLVSPRAFEDEIKEFIRTDYFEWDINLCLALAACQAAGVPSQLAVKHMLKANPDFGALKVWRIVAQSGQWIAVNAFAANDPVSTAMIYNQIRQWDAVVRLPVIGIMNVRADRGDRTTQWVRILKEGATLKFDRLLIVGDYPCAVARYLKPVYKQNVQAVNDRQPEKIMDLILSLEPAGAVIFGFCNIGGVGVDIVSYWEEHGEPICLPRVSSSA